MASLNLGIQRVNTPQWSQDGRPNLRDSVQKDLLSANEGYQMLMKEGENQDDELEVPDEEESKVHQNSTASHIPYEFFMKP